jgi:hypothetical protein
MNDPRDPETNDATDGEGSVNLSLKISSEVTSDESTAVGDSMADESFPSPAVLMSELGLVGDDEDLVGDSIADQDSALSDTPVALAPVSVLLNENNVGTALSTNIESPGPRAFLGRCTATNFRTRGVQGETWSDRAGSAGVRGVATSMGGSPSGVEGIAIATDGVGVRGEATADTGSPRGVVGSVRAGAGVLGIASKNTGITVGVWGSVVSAEGVGVLADGDGVALRARGSTSLEGMLEVGTPTQRSFTVDTANPANGQTAILVLRNVNGTLSLQRVTMGAANSGGAGFRALRVPN